MRLRGGPLLPFPGCALVYAGAARVPGSHGMDGPIVAYPRVPRRRTGHGCGTERLVVASGLFREAVRRDEPRAGGHRPVRHAFRLSPAVARSNVGLWALCAGSE